MIDQSKPVYKEIKSVEELERNINKDDITIFGFFELPKHQKVFDSFKEDCETCQINFSKFFKKILNYR